METYGVHQTVSNRSLAATISYILVTRMISGIIIAGQQGILDFINWTIVWTSISRALVTDLSAFLKAMSSLGKESWLDWKYRDIVEVLRPELAYEGANVASAESTSGPSMQAENALRDPDILRLGEELFMFYAVAGEQGIAVCKIF